MNLKSIIISFVLACTFNGFAQDEEKADTATFETRCDCFKAEYLFREEFLKSISVTEEKVIISPEFIEKFDLTSEKINSINTRCYQLEFSGIEEEPCPYEQKISELRDDFELVRRVLMMNGNHRNGH